MMLKKMMILVFAAGSLALSGCWDSDDKKTSNEASESVEQMTDDAQDTMEEAADNTQDSAEEAAESAADSMEEGSEGGDEPQ